MASPYKPSWVHWILPGLLGAIGVISLPFYFLRDPAEIVVPQSQFVHVEGIPGNIQRDSISGRLGKKIPVLKFSIGDYRTSYTGSSPNYREVSAAVQSGKSIRAGLAPIKTSTPNYAELYTLSGNGKQILKYADRSEQQKQQHSSLLIVGSALIGVAMFGSFMNVRNSRRYASLVHGDRLQVEG